MVIKKDEDAIMIQDNDVRVMTTMYDTCADHNDDGDDMMIIIVIVMIGYSPSPHCRSI